MIMALLCSIVVGNDLFCALDTKFCTMIMIYNNLNIRDMAGNRNYFKKCNSLVTLRAIIAEAQKILCSLVDLHEPLDAYY